MGALFINIYMLKANLKPGKRQCSMLLYPKKVFKLKKFFEKNLKKSLCTFFFMNTYPVKILIDINW